MTMDWSTTLLELGGGRPHPDYLPDGVSLRAVMEDPAAGFERPMFWRMKHRQQRAMREGRWKYLKVDDNEYLFDIDVDARERANLAHRQPGRLSAMRDAWLAWELTMPPIPEDATVSLGYSAKDMPQR
jgi:arylsulfatase A-like enzyme